MEEQIIQILLKYKFNLYDVSNFCWNSDKHPRRLNIIDKLLWREADIDIDTKTLNNVVSKYNHEDRIKKFASALSKAGLKFFYTYFEHGYVDCKISTEKGVYYSRAYMSLENGHIRLEWGEICAVLHENGRVTKNSYLDEYDRQECLELIRNEAPALASDEELEREGIDKNDEHFESTQVVYTWDIKQIIAVLIVFKRYNEGRRNDKIPRPIQRMIINFIKNNI